MKYTFAVITKVPEFDGTEEGAGNLANDIIMSYKGKMYGDIDIKKGFEKEMNPEFWINSKVFHLGEILILDEYGREIAGIQRKPSKWYVEYKEFDNLEDAVKLTKRIQKKIYNNLLKA